MDKKNALIFGVTGQAGSYLSELLLEKDYNVIGVHRRTSTNTFERIQHLIGNNDFNLVEGDITDPLSVSGIFNQYKPDLCFNTAAQSHVHTSFEQPTYTFLVNTVGVQYILDSIRLYSPKTRLLQFSTSEMFGNNCSITIDKTLESNQIDKDGNPIIYCVKSKAVEYQNENTPFAPASPYAASKVASHYLVKNYREAYGIFASTAMTFNYESPRRGETFVTRKITKWIGKYKNWRNQHRNQPIYFENDLLTMNGYIYTNAYPFSKFYKLRLGNINTFRDWGHCQDYCKAFYGILQQDKPNDFVISTQETHSIKDFLTIAFNEIGISNWQDYIVIDPKFYRPSDVKYLLGDSSKIRKQLGWKPKTSFKQLVQQMVRHDINEEAKKV